MKITNTPQIYFKYNNYANNNSKQSQNFSQNPINRAGELPNFAYQDYNISFGGRTPENFYEQDFNRENMPVTMKTYLDFDYNQWHHVPPEQLMNFAFKRLEGAKSFDAVKKAYPDEDLFFNLHQNTKKNRDNVLAEIRMAKELSDEPLFKDGSDDLGMYILKKIYLEGKTVKEINKDFYEKDLNGVYKGIITKPIDNNIPPAYGIKFPKSAFWHSFIATRDEYKKFFVTLPKNVVDPNRIGLEGKNSGSSGSHSSNGVQQAQSAERKPRKYNLQKFRKNQLKDDIKNSKGNIDANEVEKSVRRRFGKDDPEASFIVKYLSPIMTVAADRIHLSEEIKDFVEDEKINGKSGEEKYMLTRFWKQNPDLREFYAQSITDTIEMFEDVFGGGGVIPINSDLEVVTADKQNQKVIDYVLPEFVELLSYTQTIEPNRNARYAEHDRLQQLWTEHFNERFGAGSQPVMMNLDEDDLDGELAGVKALNPDFREDDWAELKETLINAKGIMFTDRSGKSVSMLESEIEENYQAILRAQALYFPDAYAKKYIAYMNNPEIADEKYKLSWASAPIRDIEIEDDRFMERDEMVHKALFNEADFYDSNPLAGATAAAAMSDVLVAHGFMKPSIYMFRPYEYNYMSGHIFPREEVIRMSNILEANKNELNTLYNNYLKPLSSSEKQRIAQVLMEALVNFDRKTFDTFSNGTQTDISETIDLLKDIVKTSKTYKKMTKDEYVKIIEKYPYSRTLLVENIPPEYRQRKAEEFFKDTIVETRDLSRKMVKVIDDAYFGGKKP